MGESISYILIAWDCLLEEYAVLTKLDKAECFKLYKDMSTFEMYQNGAWDNRYIDFIVAIETDLGELDND